MRQLTEDEIRKVFQKLASYIGDNVRILAEQGLFRLLKDRVFYVNSIQLLQLAEKLGKDRL